MWQGGGGCHSRLAPGTQTVCGQVLGRQTPHLQNLSRGADGGGGAGGDAAAEAGTASHGVGKLCFLLIWFKETSLLGENVSFCSEGSYIPSQWVLVQPEGFFPVVVYVSVPIIL